MQCQRELKDILDDNLQSGPLPEEGAQRQKGISPSERRYREWTGHGGILVGDKAFKAIEEEIGHRNYTPHGSREGTPVKECNGGKKAMGGASSKKCRRDFSGDEDRPVCNAPNHAALGKEEEKRASGQGVSTAPAEGILPPKKRARPEGQPAAQASELPLQYMAETNERLRGENADVRKRLQESTLKNKEYMAMLEDAAKKLRQHKEAEAKLREKLETSQNDLTQAKHKNHSLTEELKQAQDSKKSAWEASRESARDTAKYKEDIAGLEITLARIRSERDALRQENAKMKYQVKQAALALQRMNGIANENNELKKKVGQLEAKVAMLEKDPLLEDLTDEEPEPPKAPRYQPSSPSYTPSGRS